PPRRLRLPKGRISASLLLALFAGGCSLQKPSYTKEKLAEAVLELCRKEYGLEATARFTGKTLHVACDLEGLVGDDLNLKEQTLNKLEGAMLSSTRVALSTDADVNFLILRVRDPRLGVNVTLLRYLPDIKSLIYMRISRSDFEDRLVMETETSLNPEPPEAWTDIPMTEFWARLIASRLQRQFSGNPIVSAFLRIQKVTGTFKGGTLMLLLDEFQNEPTTNILIQEILRNAVEGAVADVVNKYQSAGIIRSVMVSSEDGRVLLEAKTEDILKRVKAGPAAAAPTVIQ
ncbi:MAG: hypothetical protein ACT4O3_05045, partial [Elusimicrobiota bacterium]